MKKFIKFIIPVITIFCVFSFWGCDRPQVTESSWSDDVKGAINTFLEDYGNKPDKSYVVFDFDNTTSINDIGYMCTFYQISHMSYNIAPEQMTTILHSNLSLNNDIEDNYIYDITQAYKQLYDSYGPFNINGLSDDDAKKVQETDNWKEFCAKYLSLIDYLHDNENTAITYLWMGCSYYGTTRDELYQFSKQALNYYKDIESYEYEIESPASLNSKTGQVKSKMFLGVSVTKNMQELMKALHDAKIDIWINSASSEELVRGALDVFGINEYVTGLIGIVFKYDNNCRMLCQFDMDNGCAYIKNGNKFELDNLPIKNVTEGKGKIGVLVNAVVPKYECGPIAGFMDNNGDFNFCTEFKSLKMVICFNTASRSTTNGAGLVAETAIYQRDTLHYDLKSANEAGDTLYLLQGRDENGMRTFRNSNATIQLGKTEEKLFKDENNFEQLKYIQDHHLSTKEIFDILNPGGYHSI